MLTQKFQSNHATERLQTRAALVPMSAIEIERRAAGALKHVKNKIRLDTAAMIASFENVYSYTENGSTSNGNELWAIIRLSPHTSDFRIITIMLRHSGQNVENMKVSAIIRHN